MNDLKLYEERVKSPIVQEIIMSNVIGAIAVEISKRLSIPPVKALIRFMKARLVNSYMTRVRDYIF